MGSRRDGAVACAHVGLACWWDPAWPAGGLRRRVRAAAGSRQVPRHACIMQHAAGRTRRPSGAKCDAPSPPTRELCPQVLDGAWRPHEPAVQLPARLIHQAHAQQRVVVIVRGAHLAVEAQQLRLRAVVQPLPLGALPARQVGRQVEGCSVLAVRARAADERPDGILRRRGVSSWGGVVWWGGWLCRPRQGT